MAEIIRLDPHQNLRAIHFGGTPACHAFYLTQTPDVFAEGKPPGYGASSVIGPEDYATAYPEYNAEIGGIYHINIWYGPSQPYGTGGPGSSTVPEGDWLSVAASLAEESNPAPPVGDIVGNPAYPQNEAGCYG